MKTISIANPTLLFATTFPAFLLVTFLATSAGAQVAHDHQSGGRIELGRVNFAVSCPGPAQTQFSRGIAWMHSFEYEEAEKVFSQITAADPKCSMGYWGIAMSRYHPLWAPPSEADLRAGREAIGKAGLAGAPTQRERDYIDAAKTFFSDPEKVDHRDRSNAFSDAMGRLYQRYPTDNEAAVFYALTLVAKGMATSDKSFLNEKKAADILNRVLVAEPEHPGVTHYLIHGYDFPELAHLALSAARRYAKLAPASAHAQHMPSHIFTRLGLWQEAIASNLNAKASAEAYAARHKLPEAWDEKLHAMDYLVYAYLQGGQDKKAKAVLDEMAAIKRVDPPNFKVAYSVTAIPARYALERRQWKDAAKLPPPRDLEGLSWERFKWASAHIHFARAIGAARIGDTASVRQEVEKLSNIRQELLDVKGDYDWGKQVEIQRQAAAAWLAYSEGKHEESVRLMRLVAELDDATEKHPVTPGSVLPAREQLGELLLELKQPAAALIEFETGLRRTPNRFNAIYGAARTARLMGDRKKASGHYRDLVNLSRVADSPRPEIQEAKTFTR